MAQRWGWTKLRAILPGGAQRHLSVWNGLQTVADGDPTSQYVAVHDGARRWSRRT